MKWITKNTGDGIAEIIKQQENEYNRTGIKPTQIEMSDLALTELFLQDTTQDRIEISGIKNIGYKEQVRQLIHQVTGMELVIEKLEIPDSLRTPEYIKMSDLALTKLFLQDTTQDRIKISGIKNIRYREQVRQLIHQVMGIELIIEKLEIPDSLRTPEYIEQERLLELSKNVFNTWWLEGSSDNFKVAIEELGALLGLM